MIDLRVEFDSRVVEVKEYLNLVYAIEQSLREGLPLISGKTGSGSPVNPVQQRLLYAGVYLHLYNLVEATVSQCISALETAASTSGMVPFDLSTELRQEWVRSVARTHEDLNTSGRLEAAIKMCEHLVALLPIRNFEIFQGGGGNWDDEEIYKLSQRLGINLQCLQRSTQAQIKRPFRDNDGALKVIKKRRNKLAHGEISFAECGDGLSASELEMLSNVTTQYLSEVIACFERHISERQYLHPTKRSA